MKNSARILVALSILLAASPLTAALRDSEFVIVVNANNPTIELPRGEVSRMFLKKDRSWGHGLTVEPVDQPQDEAVRQAFSIEIHRRSADTIEGYWNKVLFEGLGSPPPEVPGDGLVLDFVRRNRGAIGYVSAGTPMPKGVQVLEVSE